jgi:hypothetical protein
MPSYANVEQTKDAETRKKKRKGINKKDVSKTNNEEYVGWKTRD